MVTAITSENVLGLIGLSTDTKPTNEIIGNGSTFYEIDTCKTYIYDKTNQVWVAQKSTVPVVIDVTSDMIDSEDATNGQVLTANGSGGAEWSDIPTPTITADNIDSEDSTLGQILTADGEGGASWEDIPVPTTYQSFNDSWTTNSTTATFCEDLLVDDSVTPAMAYLGEVTFTDKPFNGNAEIVVEVQEGPSSGVGKALHLILTSGSDAPYRWEYTYWKIGSTPHTSGWIGFQPEITNSSITTGTIENALGFDSSGNLIKGTISSGASEIDLNDATYTSSETYYTLDKSYDNEIPTIINPNSMDYKENYPNAIYITLLDGYGKFYAASVTKDSVGSPAINFNGYLLINKFVHQINVTILLDLQNQTFSIDSIGGGDNVYVHIGQLAQDLTFPIVELIPCRHISKEENSSYVVSNLLNEYFTNFDFAGMYAVYMRVPEARHE